MACSIALKYKQISCISIPWANLPYTPYPAAYILLGYNYRVTTDLNYTFAFGGSTLRDSVVTAVEAFLFLALIASNNAINI